MIYRRGSIRKIHCSPEEKLCRKYNASRSTLRRALNMLKETGVLYSVQGNGTYIKPFVFTQPLSDFYSFTDTLKSSNILIQNSVIHYDLVKADKSLAIETGIRRERCSINCSGSARPGRIL
ncbi:GntR family transcriptional regulator [Flavonifractor plautii]|nr:GntR family transcriptional regulator [Flavonifractor plautii]